MKGCLSDFEIKISRSARGLTHSATLPDTVVHGNQTWSVPLAIPLCHTQIYTAYHITGADRCNLPNLAVAVSLIRRVGKSLTI